MTSTTVSAFELALAKLKAGRDSQEVAQEMMENLSESERAKMLVEVTESMIEMMPNRQGAHVLRTTMDGLEQVIKLSNDRMPGAGDLSLAIVNLRMTAKGTVDIDDFFRIAHGKSYEQAKQEEQTSERRNPILYTKVVD